MRTNFLGIIQRLNKMASPSHPEMTVFTDSMLKMQNSRLLSALKQAVEGKPEIKTFGSQLVTPRPEETLQPAVAALRQRGHFAQSPQALGKPQAATHLNPKGKAQK